MIPVIEKEYATLTARRAAPDALDCRFSGNDSAMVAGADYNAVLYAAERNMAFFMRELAMQGDKVWERRAADRQRQMRRLMADPVTKRYHDYDYAASERKTPIRPVTGWAVLWSELTDKSESLQQGSQPLDSLSAMEMFFALRALEKGKFTARRFARLGNNMGSRGVRNPL